MLRTVLLILATVCAFGLGRISKEVETRTVYVPGPVQIVMPTANRGVEITEGIRWINLDADIPIMQVANESALKAMSGYDGPGFIMGAYTPDSPAIYVLGTWTFECETALHEYTHMLEHELPDQAYRIRRAFHRLCSDKFRMDSNDLIPELPEPDNLIGVPAPSP